MAQRYVHDGWGRFYLGNLSLSFDQGSLYLTSYETKRRRQTSTRDSLVVVSSLPQLPAYLRYLTRLLDRVAWRFTVY